MSHGPWTDLITDILRRAPGTAPPQPATWPPAPVPPWRTRCRRLGGCVVNSQIEACVYCGEKGVT